MTGELLAAVIVELVLLVILIALGLTAARKLDKDHQAIGELTEKLVEECAITQDVADRLKALELLQRSRVGQVLIVEGEGPEIDSPKPRRARMRPTRQNTESTPDISDVEGSE